MGSKWRETLNPEEHCSGGEAVVKLIRNAQKQQPLQAYSDRPDADKKGFDYWALTCFVSKSQLRPHRPLYGVVRRDRSLSKILVIAWVRRGGSPALSHHVKSDKRSPIRIWVLNLWIPLLPISKEMRRKNMISTRYPRFKTIYRWMGSYRPGSRRAIPSNLNVGEVPDGRRKVSSFWNVRHLPKSIGISPVNRFRQTGENAPPMWLMAELERIGSEWRGP